jgi:threonine/homoserine/homoserine lactone efflux protein
MTKGELITLALLGAFHGVNPGMGWLFAVSIGLQERSRKALLLSLPFIALGHEGSVAVMAIVAAVTRSLTASRVVILAVGGVLLVYGLWQLIRARHKSWAGMRLSHWGLARWSFVMSSAHGAGLMVLPVIAVPLYANQGLDTSFGLLHGLEIGALAAAVHSAAMILMTGTVAVLVYDVLGLSVLRKWWVNVDKLWAVSLVGAGTVVLLTN